MTQVFISHASKDNVFIKTLREALEQQGIGTWVDSRELSAGMALSEEIKNNILAAEYILVVLSPNSIKSDWVFDEIDWAKEHGKTIIPLCFPEVEHNTAKRLIGKELLILPFDPSKPIDLILPDLLAALGKQKADGLHQATEVREKPLAELLLKLYEPKESRQEDNSLRYSASAELLYHPADGSPSVSSPRFRFIAPLGAIEASDLSWYLEQYLSWPVGVFKDRGEVIEAQLPRWGESLQQAALPSEKVRKVAGLWQQDSGEKRFSIEVDSTALEGASEDEQAETDIAATELLALPWELLRDDNGWLFQGAKPAHVHRRLPNAEKRAQLQLDLPIRVLLLSPRPEQEGTGYIDHRVSALPLSEALASLGGLAELTVLSPPTFPAMQAALQTAHAQGKPFHVLHFDGHGVYDRRKGLGALCFEEPADSDKLQQRRTALVYADELAATLNQHRIPLVFLEACQTAQSEEKIDASVAGSLLQKGVSSVVAMSHSVWVETARRFVMAFYQSLAKGKRVGSAMLAGQQALYGDSVRGYLSGAGELRLQDWFVPVLYQEQLDPLLFKTLPSERMRHLAAQQQRLSLGDLPETPAHQFIGRSRELLALERLLLTQPYAVLRGIGGAGKTTLAAELARWFVQSRRVQRAAFVSVEHIHSQRALLDVLGRQLLPNWSVAEQSDAESLQQVQRALADAPCLIVFDNCESLLNLTGFENLSALATECLNAASHSRVLFTSREQLPAPFANNTVQLGALSHADALDLLARVLAQKGLPLPTPDSKDHERARKDLLKLVDSLHAHARALVLLAPELARQGIDKVTNEAEAVLAQMDKQYPGERENSLYASLELSLRRLPEELRGLCEGLAVFEGGVHMQTLDYVLKIPQDDMETIPHLFQALIEVGLGEDAGYGHLHLDPVLPLYLRRGLAAAKLQTYQQRHTEAMQALLGFLYQQQSKDAELAYNLTLLELPNLQALLQQSRAALAAETLSPQRAIEIASAMETLLKNLHRPEAMAAAVALRKEAKEQLDSQAEVWSRAHYLQASSQIDRLLQQGDLQQAYSAAQNLLDACLQAGETAYAGAAYDTAVAYFKLGRVLNKGGVAQQALAPLQAAQKRFQALAETGGEEAARMAAVCLSESADCHRDLGHLDTAADLYEKRIALGEKRDDKRGVAIGKGQLGTVRLLQKDYAQALQAFADARELFSQLQETRSVAIAWHQTGVVYKGMQQWAQAEQAYRQSMQLEIKQGNRAGEASSLNELGNLYSEQGRAEQAVAFYRQAADIYTQLGDNRYEGLARSNVADELIKLQRHSEARRELLRAIECKQELDHAAEPWKTWMILHNLEQAENHPEEAAKAKAKAVGAYLAYRRDGGENHSSGGRLCHALLQALQSQDSAAQQQIGAQLAGYLQDPELAEADKTFVLNLQSLLQGRRDPALAQDPALSYELIAELQYLLEQLA